MVAPQPSRGLFFGIMIKNRVKKSPMGKQAYWKISLFGGLKITKDGEPIEPPPYRTYGLLVFLLLREKLPIRRERLGSLLYGDLPDHKIRGRITDHIWHIKKQLPGFPLITTTENIDIDRQFIWVDVKTFQNEVNNPQNPGSEKFLELYQGELLPELYDEWVLVERERWHNHYLRMLHTLINNLIGKEDFDKAIMRMERLLRDEPYDEEVVRLLMQTYSKVGRRGAALAIYEKFHLLSTKQIGLDPDAKTKQIYEVIKSQATTPRRMTVNDNISPPFIVANPDEILRQAQSVLDQGDRVQLKRWLDTLPKKLSYDQILWSKMLEFDQKLTWGELEQAETILQQYDISSPTLRLRQAKLALAKQDPQKAKALVETLLDDAHRLHQPELEAETLLILSISNSAMGKIQDSLAALDRVISLSRKVNAHAIRVQAYIQKGKYWRLKGAEESAQDILEQAVSLARRNNLLPLLCLSLDSLSITFNYYGNYQNGLKYATEGLELARDLGLTELEAKLLLNLNYSFDYLGRHEEATEALTNASQIYEEQKDNFGLAKCYYNLAYGFVNEKIEKPLDAIKYGKDALQIFVQVQNLGYQASTHTALGYFHWLAGHADQAIKHYDAAIAIHTELEENLFIPELYAFKGLAFVQRGDAQQGMEFTQLAIRELIRQNLSDVDTEIYYAHACAALALGKKKDAKAYVQLGYERYLESAGQIEDDEARMAFFERGPITRRLMKMAYDFGLAPRPKKKVITHQLPGPSHYKMKLELTADAGPADQALGESQGLTALRRAKLKRIMKEGNTHGSQLTIKEMAKLFNVSPRTIHRDLKTIEVD